MKEFTFDFFSREDHDYLAIEISFRGQRVCQLMRDKVTDRITIEMVEDRRILDPPVRLSFSLQSFLAAIQEGCDQLMTLRL
jgi:hypothetical protein